MLRLVVTANRLNEDGAEGHGLSALIVTRISDAGLISYPTAATIVLMLADNAICPTCRHPMTPMSIGGQHCVLCKTIVVQLDDEWAEVMVDGQKRRLRLAEFS